MNKKIALSFLLGCLISGVALYLAFKNVPMEDLLQYLSTINYWWVIPGILAIVLAFVFRVIRWRVIVGSVQKIGFWEAFHPLFIGFMINGIFPRRIGELVRPGILQARSRVAFPAGLATVATERLLDLFLLLLLFAVVLFTVPIDPSSQFRFSGYEINKALLVKAAKGMLFLGVVIIAAMVSLTLLSVRNRIASMIFLLPRALFFLDKARKEKIREKLCSPLVRFVENTARGFSLVREPKRIYICLIVSVPVWLFQALSFYFTALGCPGLSVSFLQITAVMVVTCFAIALPSVPGYWGLWEAGGVFALTIFNVAPRQAAGYTLANHAIQLFPVMLIGICSAWIIGVRIRSTFESAIAPTK